MLSPVERIQADGVVGRALERIYTLLTAIRKVPILDGVLLTGIELAGGDYTEVPHGLNRLPFGYLVLTRDDDAVVYEDKSLRSTRSITLQTSATPLVVDLWIF